jgi:hypothetical protein
MPSEIKSATMTAPSGTNQVIKKVFTGTLNERAAIRLAALGERGTAPLWQPKNPRRQSGKPRSRR